MYNNRTINKYLSTSSLLTNLCLHWQIIWTSHGSINFCEMLLIKLLRWTRALEKKIFSDPYMPQGSSGTVKPFNSCGGDRLNVLLHEILDHGPSARTLLTSQPMSGSSYMGQSRGLLPSPLPSCLKWSLHQASWSPCVHAPTPCQLLGGSPCSLPAQIGGGVS